jgi:hypothetical protein
MNEQTDHRTDILTSLLGFAGRHRTNDGVVLVWRSFRCISDALRLEHLVVVTPVIPHLLVDARARHLGDAPVRHAYAATQFSALDDFFRAALGTALLLPPVPGPRQRADAALRSWA